MVSSRRTNWNLALQTAISRAREYQRPLVVLEAIRHDYRWACPRFHQFVLDGMADNKRAFEESSIHYYPYVEPHSGAGKGLISTLSKRAVLIVTDHKPGFFMDRMQSAAAKRSFCSMIRIDDNGILPLAASDRAWPTAYSFRRHLQKTLPPYLNDLINHQEEREPKLPKFHGLQPSTTARWPAADIEALRKQPSLLGLLGPQPVANQHGGSIEAHRKWNQFLTQNLDDYQQNRNATTPIGTSSLAPYLHFGHISSRQMVFELLKRFQWTSNQLGIETRGARTGWWGLSESCEAFLDQLITWRELGHVFCDQVPNFSSYETLPKWAIETLESHANDPRPYLYTLEQLDQSLTHDPVWNAAQTQLREQGTIHNYLRMLWGKKILEWSPSAPDALTAMVELNNRYALDGRDPNSYSGIFWCLGRFDRAWGPERPIFGKVRYMSSENTKRKMKLGAYLGRWAPSSDPQQQLRL